MNWKSIAVVICSALLSFSVNASGQTYKVINPEQIKQVVADVDSITTLYQQIGSRLETADMVSKLSTGDVSTESIQSTYADADASWSTFVGLCKKNSFKEAYEYYKEHPGDFLICFPHSEPRYIFLTYVLTDMILEFEPEEETDAKILEILDMEYMMEFVTVYTNAETTGYVPENFPYLLVNYGVMLVRNGRLDDALALADEYEYAVYSLSEGNDIYANFTNSYFQATIYQSAGMIKEAREVLQEYKNKARELVKTVEDEGEKEMYEYCIEKADQIIRNQLQQ